MKPHILVVGGAGYIGSHMVKCLARNGYQPVTLDNLSQGHRDAVTAGPLIVGDLGDPAALDVLFQAYPIKAVMHFASFIQVGESVQKPSKYYDNNMSNTVGLLDSMVRHGVKNFVFSSTAAIFGDPQYVPIDERHPANPINPYGRSKLMVEAVLDDFDRAYGLRSCCLRYFNAAGADPEGQLGERHEPETHLIPLVLQVASGRRPAITVYGQDYDTPDGTCIRDYIHVQDLCDAHLLALEAQLNGGPSKRYNLGNGNGYSVREVIAAVERVTARPIAEVQGARRDGDPARLVADPSLAKAELGWTPQFAALDKIIEHAWAWEQKHIDRPAPVLRALQGGITGQERLAGERRQVVDRRA